MFRIDAPGFAPGNLFTDGDPGVPIPATVVSDEWLNEVQEEIALVAEETGQTLTKASQNQLNAGILEYFLRGGLKTPLSQVIANNTGPAAVTGFLMDKDVSLAKMASFYIERKTTTQVVIETGLIACRYNSKDDGWDLEFISQFDDSGVTFTLSGVTTATQLNYTTDDLTGASYVGLMKLTNIFEIRV